MKIKKGFCVTYLFISIVTYGQISKIQYDNGTNIEIGNGADVCADSIFLNGTQTGNGTFCILPVNVANEDPLISLKFSLSQNYPNPFNPSTIIKYSIPEIRGNINQITHLSIFDILGEELVTLVNKAESPGNYEVKFDASGLTSGVYFYKLNYGQFSETKKLLLLK